MWSGNSEAVLSRNEFEFLIYMIHLGKIHNGENGIQYLDYKLLADILSETEPKK